MGANPLRSGSANGADLVREHLLTGIHVGRLKPGDRVPSVRGLAKITGVNHKTVHRAYTSLAKDGILEVRPGSGTFVKTRMPAGSSTPIPDLLAALERLRAEAHRLGLAPELLSEFFGVCFADGLRGTRLALVECNWEQIAMIGRDVQRELGIRSHPVRLDVLARNPARALGGLQRVLTTECHYAEVVERLEALPVSVHTITLSETFPRRVLDAARDGRVLMVVRDFRFGQSFGRLLERLSRGSRLVERVRFVGERDALKAFGEAPPGTHVYLSPLIPTSLWRAVPRTARRIESCWRVEARALETLRAELGIERALRVGPR